MILVTGSESYLGEKLVTELINQGQPVRCMDIYKPQDKKRKAEFIQSDLQANNVLRKACEGIDIVIHMLDIKSSRRQSRKKMKMINIQGTANLLRAAQAAGVKRFLFLSSYEVYGKSEKIPTRYDDKKKPVTVYGKDKLRVENLCFQAHKENEFDVTVFRPALISGPGVTNPQILITLYMALGMGDDNRLYIAGDGHKRVQLLHPDDAVQAFLLALKSENCGGKIYNIGSDYVPTQKEMIEHLNQKLDVYCEIKKISPLKARLLSLLLRPFQINYLTKDHLLYLLNNILLDCQRIKTDLKWDPQHDNVSILLETIEWYRKEKL